jgi:2'-5' RNA ligase
MRCFIAIDVSEEVRHSIGSAIEKMKQLSRGVRWVSPGNIHLTLKFLGEVDDVAVNRVKERLSLICAGHGPFVLAINGAGGFPNLRSPNILWIGIDESEQLKLLNLDIEKAMCELGFARENKSFSPHLTVGRVSSRKDLDAVIREWITLKDTFFGSISVGETLLMKSTLKPAGAEYSKIAEFKLRKTVE